MILCRPAVSLRLKYASQCKTTAETWQHDSDCRRKDEHRTRNSLVTNDHTHCTPVGCDGCERRRGLYTWQCCGSKCRTCDIDTTRPASFHCLMMHPGYSRLAHTWQLTDLVLILPLHCVSAMKTHQHQLQRKTYNWDTISHQCQCTVMHHCDSEEFSQSACIVTLLLLILLLLLLSSSFCVFLCRR